MWLHFYIYFTVSGYFIFTISLYSGFGLDHGLIRLKVSVHSPISFAVKNHDRSPWPVNLAGPLST